MNINLSMRWIGVLLFFVLMVAARAETIGVTPEQMSTEKLVQMSNEQLIQILADSKWGDNAFGEIVERLNETNYSQDSELADILFHHWQNNENEKIRGWCFRGLTLIKSQKAVNVLIPQLLQGSTRRDRVLAAHYLGEIGSASAVTALESAVRTDEGVLGSGRSIARKSIFALGKIGSPAVSTLMKIWNDSTLRRDCEEAVVSAMGLTKDMTFAPVLVRILGGKEELIRDNAAWALGEIGNDTLLPKLREYQNDSNNKVKENILNAITKIKQRIQNMK